MKRFFKAATSAALIASMVCAPSAFVVSAAETAAFEVYIADQVIQEGTSKANIPVSFSRDVTFKSIEMEFDCSGFVSSKAKCAIKDIVSALPADSGVTAAVNGNKITLTSADGYTLKKGSELLNIAFEVTELVKVGTTEKWPLNVPARIKLSSFKMTSAGGSVIELSESGLNRATGNVQVAPSATAGLEVTMDSVFGTEDLIKVPVRVKGRAYSIISEIRVSEYAEVVGFEAETPFEGTKINTTTDGLLRMVWTSQKGLSDVIFNGDVVGYIVIKVKDADAGLSRSDLSFALIDIATSNGVSNYPAVVKGAMAVKGLKGDINLDGEVDARDATYNLTSYLENRGGNPDYLKNEFAADPAMAELVEAFSAEKLAETALKLGDVNSDGINDTRDASFQIQYYLESRAGETSWESVLGE